MAALINQKDNFVDGIKFAQEVIDGSLTLLIMTDDGEILAARDKMGRLPVLVGKNDDGHCISFESFPYHKLGYDDEYELGPGEIVRVNADSYETISPAGDDMKICAFLWTYYGYPNSNYEGQNVEVVRYRNGAIMARDEAAQGRLPRSTTSPACPTPACRTRSATPPRARRPSPVPSSSTPPRGRARSCPPTRRCATASPR